MDIFHVSAYFLLVIILRQMQAVAQQTTDTASIENLSQNLRHVTAALGEKDKVIEGKIKDLERKEEALTRKLSLLFPEIFVSTEITGDKSLLTKMDERISVLEKRTEELEKDVSSLSNTSFEITSKLDDIRDRMIMLENDHTSALNNITDEVILVHEAARNLTSKFEMLNLGVNELRGKVEATSRRGSSNQLKLEQLSYTLNSELGPLFQMMTQSGKRIPEFERKIGTLWNKTNENEYSVEKMRLNLMQSVHDVFSNISYVEFKLKNKLHEDERILNNISSNLSDITWSHQRKLESLENVTGELLTNFSLLTKTNLKRISKEMAAKLSSFDFKMNSLINSVKDDVRILQRDFTLLNSSKIHDDVDLSSSGDVEDSEGRNVTLIDMLKTEYNISVVRDALNKTIKLIDVRCNGYKETSLMSAMILDVHGIFTLVDQLYKQVRTSSEDIQSLSQKILKNSLTLNDVKDIVSNLSDENANVSGSIMSTQEMVRQLGQVDEEIAASLQALQTRIHSLQIDAKRKSNAKLDDWIRAQKRFHIVRLVGGKSAGRLEINLDGSWGTVCDDGFGANEARVVCRQLGFRNGQALSFPSYGTGNGNIVMDDVTCTGYEMAIQHCIYKGKHEHNCSHREDVGVSCST